MDVDDAGFRRRSRMLFARSPAPVAFAVLAFTAAIAAIWLFLADPSGDEPENVAHESNVQQRAGNQGSGARAGEGAGSVMGAAMAVADAAEKPYQPRLLSANRNLSYARRGGLHQQANLLRLTASAALALDQATGAVLYARNENAILPIASITKLLSAMVLLDARLPMSARIRVTPDDVDRLRHSRSRLPVGTTLTRAEALRLALMSSENRAAHAIARTFPGGLAAFVREMNRKAAELGMNGSAFTDPTGLSSSNQATAFDVARLVAGAARHALLRANTTTLRHRATFGKRRVQYVNSNRLVRSKAWPIVLQKTGYIVESGHCMALVTKIRNRAVILVLLDSGSAADGAADARKLRSWLAAHPEAAHPAVPLEEDA